MPIAKLAGIGDKLEGIQGQLDVVSDLFENPIADFAEGLLGGIDFGDFGIPDVVTGLFDKIPDFPGLEIGLDKLSGFGSCFANLDDLIVDMLKEKLIDMIISFPPGMAAATLMSTVFSTIEVVQGVVDDIIALTQLSLRDLIIMVQNSDFFQRIGIIAKITELYGKAIQSINDFIATIMDLDPCNLINFKPGSSTPAPTPGTAPDGPPVPAPRAVQNFAVNNPLESIVRGFSDATFAIGQVLSKDRIEQDDLEFKGTPQFNSAMAHLHHIAHAFRKQVEATGDYDGTKTLARLQARSDETIQRKANEWGEEASAWFINKLNRLLPTCKECASKFANYKAAKINPQGASANYDTGFVPRHENPNLKPAAGAPNPGAPAEGADSGALIIPIDTSGQVRGGFPASITIPHGDGVAFSPLRGKWKHPAVAKTDGGTWDLEGWYEKTDDIGEVSGSIVSYEELRAAQYEQERASAADRTGLQGQGIPPARPGLTLPSGDGKDLSNLLFRE